MALRTPTAAGKTAPLEQWEEVGRTVRMVLPGVRGRDSDFVEATEELVCRPD